MLVLVSKQHGQLIDDAFLRDLPQLDTAGSIVGVLINDKRRERLWLFVALVLLWQLLELVGLDALRLAIYKENVTGHGLG